MVLRTLRLFTRLTLETGNRARTRFLTLAKCTRFHIDGKVHNAESGVALHIHFSILASAPVMVVARSR